jgi:hypothetical protein
LSCFLLLHSFLKHFPTETLYADDGRLDSSDRDDDDVKHNTVGNSPTGGSSSSSSSSSSSGSDSGVAKSDSVPRVVRPGNTIAMVLAALQPVHERICDRRVRTSK